MRKKRGRKKKKPTYPRRGQEEHSSPGKHGTPSPSPVLHGRRSVTASYNRKHMVGKSTYMMRLSVCSILNTTFFQVHLGYPAWILNVPGALA